MGWRRERFSLWQALSTVYSSDLIPDFVLLDSLTEDPPFIHRTVRNKNVLSILEGHLQDAVTSV